ncbi:MAG: hypothetical protein AAF645_23380, partial [Myxococcota bacterium]
RAVEPAPPRLWLDVDAVAAVLDADARAAEASLDEAAEALWTLYEAQGRAEAGEGESEDDFAQRRRDLRTAVAAVEASARDSNSDGAADGTTLRELRGRVSHGLGPALAGERSDEEAFLGTFPRMLERYGHPPSFVARTLFVARFNGIVDRPLTEGMSDVELQAYWGWLVFGAEDAPMPQRLSALTPYEDAGGEASEARAWLALRAGDALRAARLYGAAAEASGSLRLRNYALACEARAAAAPPSL